MRPWPMPSTGSGRPTPPGSVRAPVEERRSATERLLDEVRRALMILRENRAGVRGDQPTGRAPGPVLPRYSGAAPDPLDGVRQELHEAYAQTRDAAVRAELVAS